MQIDEKTLEAIVREIVERLLARQPELFAPSPVVAESEQIHEHYGRLLSEDVLLICRKQGKRAIRIEPKTILTPLARDRVRDLGIRILVRDA
jgi:hypothetical protein